MNFRLKKFLSYYKPYTGLLVTDLLCAFIVAASTLVFPLLTRYITKNVSLWDASSALIEITKVGIFMVILIVVQALCSYYSDYRGHAMGAMMERDLRNELFDHLQKLSFKFFDENKIGMLMSRITNDLLLLSEFYHHAPEDYVVSLVKFFGAFFILINIDVKLTLIVFLFLPIMAIFSLYFNKKMRAALKRNFERISEINTQVEDSLSGIRIVKSFANEKLENKKFADKNENFLNSRKLIYKNEAILYNGMSAFVQLVTFSVIIFGGAAIVNVSLDLPDLITFLLYIGNLMEPIQKLNHITVQFQQGITGFTRFMEIMDIDPEIQDSPNAIELKNIKGNVELRNVSFGYRDNREYVLKNLSFKVKHGEYIAIVGTSGIGKTTLCSLIPRFYDVNEGEVLFDGINVKDIKLSSLRQNIGVVQQDVYLFAGTVLDNIQYGKPGATIEEVKEAAKKANAHDFIMNLPDGYETDIGQRGVKLSGGQKQRLSIARAFLKDPAVLIFDEATSALDNESEKVVRESLEALAENRTAFVIAHRISTIRNAKRILVLTDLGIEEQGTHDELMARNGTYTHLYNL